VGYNHIGVRGDLLGEIMERNIKCTISLVTVLLVILCSFSFGQAPDTLWTRLYGNEQQDLCFCGQQTSDGGYILYGQTYLSNYRATDIYIVKTDPTGNVIWDKTFGGDSMENTYWGQQTSDGGYIIAASTRSYGGFGFPNAYLVKLDPSGDTLWTKIYGDTTVAYFVQQTSDSGYIVAGMICPAFTTQAYAVKTDSLGDTLWTKMYGGFSEDFWRSARQTNDGGYIFLGKTGSFGAGAYDLWLLKTNSNGDSLWAKTYGGPEHDYGMSICPTSDGGYIIAGMISSFGAGDQDLWLLRIDQNGDTLWTKRYGGPQDECGLGVQLVPSGGFIVVGYTTSFGAGDYDYYVLRTDIYGDTLWSATYGGLYKDYSASVNVTADNGYAVIGYTDTQTANQRDFWIVRVMPDTFNFVESNQGKVLKSYLEFSSNPFRSSVEIFCNWGSGKIRELEIFNIEGRLIKSYSLNNWGYTGSLVLAWDGSDNVGRVVESGIYFLILEIDDYRVTKKLIKLK
jgi:hypothetical protein